MRNQRKASHTAVLSVLIVTLLAGASRFAKATDLQVIGINNKVAVHEFEPGELSWMITNPNTLSVVLDSNPATAGWGFVYSGDDMDDKPLITRIGGCNQNVTLVPGTIGCILTVAFTTPAVPDTTPDENMDRGFWNLAADVRIGLPPVLFGHDANGTSYASEPITGFVEVDDPGVPSIIPEPPTIVTLLTSVIIGGAGWAFRRNRRNTCFEQPSH
jgi:hypothetical protein